MRILKNKHYDFKIWFVDLYGTSSRTRSHFDNLGIRKKNNDFDLVIQDADVLRFGFYDLLDYKFEKINPKYLELTIKYGSIIHIEHVLDLAFPQFVRLIIKNWKQYRQRIQLGRNKS